MDKYLQRQMVKAKAIAAMPRAIEPYGVGYRVRSSRGGWYYARVILTKGKLTHAQCNCPSFGEAKYNGVPVCKHTLAICFALTKRTVRKAVAHNHTIREEFNANAKEDHKPVLDRRPMFYPAPPW